MEQNTGVYTQADNFFGANGNNVDPRTGLFGFHFNFNELSDCEVVGPKVNLALSYTPMQTHNAYGLGTGFSLSGISVYNRKDNLLSLYSGEKYKTKDIYGLNQVTVLQQKMKVIDFKKTDQNNYVLTTKSGEVTHFKSLPQGGQWLVPEYIESPLGYRLYFAWKSPVNDQPPRLHTVANHNKKVLFEITYPQNTGGKVSITSLPGSEKNKSEVELSFTNEYLTTLKNVTDAFQYELAYSPQANVKINGKSPLESITFPTGLKESVQYAPDVMKLPTIQGVLSYPAVTVHRLSPGQNQPDVVTGYDYSEKNYLGNLADKLDLNSPGDALYNVVSDYAYHSVEKLLNEKNESVKEIKREYNKYHLQVSETTTYLPERCSVTSENKYSIKANRPFDEQPVNFLLPEKQIRTWKAGRGADAPEREEITEFTYDEFGNLQTQKAPDGTITVNDYYPASDADGCPKDPNGFTRFIKSTTVTPPDVYGDEPIQRTEYRYKKMGTLPGSHVAYSVLQDVVTHKINDQIKFTEAFTYHDAAGVNFGRVKTKIQTQHDKDGKKYLSRQHLSVSVQAERLVQTVDSEISDENGVSPLFSVSSHSELCRATGKMLSETDAAGNRVDYDYDNLGRLLKKTHHPDKPEYTSTETYDYILPDSKAGTPAQTVHTDIRGNKTRIDYDGLGRKLAQWMTDRDSETQKGEPEWNQVAGLEYDSTGLASQLTQRDVLHTGKAIRQAVEGWKTRTWDKWGQPYAEKGHDGVISYSETDPIALTTTTRTASEDGKKVTGKQVVYYNESQQPVKTELLTAEGKSYAVNLQDRDGAQRLRKTTDTLGRVTAFTYDDEGRVTETRLPDDSVIKKSYAPFTSEALITRISLTEKGGSEVILGTQVFDRLGRLKETTSGGRTTTMTYDAAWQTQPSTVTGPDKVVQAFTRDPALGEVVTKLNAGSGSNAMSQTFDYELPTATLKEAKESDTTTHWKPYLSGRVKSEVSTIKGGQENAQGFKYSLAGAVEQDTDISNITRQHHYGTSGKSSGQLIEVSDEDVTLTPAYDELQRMTGWTAKDKAGRTLTTALTLDDFGREEGRTVTHSNGESFTLTRKWKPNNQLESSTRSRGDKVLLEETYFYDVRNRLEKYQAGPIDGELPKDPYGNAFTEQRFTFDALGNIRTCTTVLKDGSQNVATFHFDNPADPCQLTSVTNSLTGKNYPAEIKLEYDDAGRMTKDEAGRTLRYDALGRLQQVISEKGSGRYGYDASNRLCWQIVDKTQQLHRLYYRGNKLANEWLTPEGQAQDAAKDNRVRLVYAGGSNIAQINQDGSTSTTSLIGTDAKNSVIAAQVEGKNQQYQYTPYGYRTDVSAGDSVAEASEENRDE
jgi:YD repeat-containing protein